MNKSDLVSALADGAGLTKATATRAVEALFSPDDGILAEELKKGGRVQITGFGTFDLKAVAARIARHPRTGARITIAGRRRARFRPGKGLKLGIVAHAGDAETEPPEPEMAPADFELDMAEEEVESIAHAGDPETDPPPPEGASGGMTIA